MPPVFDDAALKRHALMAQMAPASPAAESTEGPTGIGAAPYVAAVGGQAADALSSLYNFHRGYGESNFGGSKAAMLAFKAGAGALVPLLMRKIAKKDPKTAKVLGYATGIAGAVPAAYNLTRPNLK